MSPILLLMLLSGAPAPAVAERRVTVDAVWYSPREGGIGGTSPVEITIRPNASHAPKVGIFEDRSQGTGEQWRNSVWMAAYLAALTAQRSPTEIEVTVSSSGKIDGPSAGGLMTAGMLAGLLGAKVDPLAAMSGTINPDGTIGPVGGLPLKLQGAAKNGKKRFGYPLGERIEEDPGTGKLVDLNRLGASLQVETREVRDVYDAYRLMTGKELPRPEALPQGQLALSAEADDVLQKTALQWLQLASQKAEALGKAKGPDGETLKDVVETRDRAVAELRQGNTAAAYQAAFQAAVGTIQLEMTRQVSGTPAEAHGAVVALTRQLAAEVAEEEKRLAAHQPTTIPELVRAISASGMLVQCRVFLSRAVQSLESYEAIASGKAPPPPEWKPLEGLEPGPERDEWTAMAYTMKLHEPVIHLAPIRPLIQKERAFLAVPVPRGAKAAVSTEDLRGLARMYAGLAEANLDYYESLVVRPGADRAGLSFEKVRAAFMPRVYEYSEALLDLAASNQALEGDSPASAMTAIAAAQRSQRFSSLLIAIHYSLQIARDGGDQVTSVGRPKAFAQMLESAEQKARETAALARQAAGAVPMDASLFYEDARAGREGDPTAKLAALRGYWASSGASQLAALLARAGAR